MRVISLSTSAKFRAPAILFSSANLLIAYSVTFVYSLAEASLRVRWQLAVCVRRQGDGGL